VAKIDLGRMLEKNFAGLKSLEFYFNGEVDTGLEEDIGAGRILCVLMYRLHDTWYFLLLIPEGTHYIRIGKLHLHVKDFKPHMLQARCKIKLH
jgi:hypothetical protein